MEKAMIANDGALASKRLPTAKEAIQKIALAEAKKASEALQQKEKAEAEKKALLERLSKPTGITDEEALAKAAAIIERAAQNGLSEGEGIRFPNAFGTD